MAASPFRNYRARNNFCVREWYESIIRRIIVVVVVSLLLSLFSPPIYLPMYGKFCAK